MLSVVALGIARAAIDEVLGMAAGRTSVTGAPNLGDRIYVQLEVAKIEAELRAARSWFYGAIDDAWQVLLAGGEPSDHQVSMLRLSTTHASRVGAERGPAHLVRLSRAHFDAWARQYPEAALTVMNNLAQIGALRLAAGLDDGLQRGGLVREIATCHLHQIGNQVIPALELHINLAQRVGNAVSQLHQPVVNSDSPHQQYRQNTKDDPPCC